MSFRLFQTVGYYSGSECVFYMTVHVFGIFSDVEIGYDIFQNLLSLWERERENEREREREM
jgi:hypothetical protein